MTVITVAPSDGGDATVHWKVPPDPQLNESPIPRGLRFYGGSSAVAALGTNDETLINVRLTFPSAYCYLPKSLSLEFLSDDTTSEFGDIGGLTYNPGGIGAAVIGTRKVFELFSDGQWFLLAVKSVQTYRPMGNWRQWIYGNAGDQLQLNITDMSNDTSTAGDVRWNAEFWEFDINQCLSWQANTPQPVVIYN